jgi:hypothetical protein
VNTRLGNAALGIDFASSSMFRSGRLDVEYSLWRLFGSNRDSAITAIAGRVRTVLSGHRVEVIADELDIPLDPTHELLEQLERPIDRAFLLDVVAALVHKWGIDPAWLLSGEYDGGLHREALVLGEDRTRRGLDAVRGLVEHAYRQQRHARLFTSPFARDHQHRAAS